MKKKNCEDRERENKQKPQVRFPENKKKVCTRKEKPFATVKNKGRIAKGKMISRDRFHKQARLGNYDSVMIRKVPGRA